MIRITSLLSSSGIVLVCAIQACTYEVIPEPENCANPPALQLVSVASTGCGVASGSIQVQASGGEAPYVFRINAAGDKTEGKFDGLVAGNYNITVEDSKGCTNLLAVEVKNQDGLNITVETGNAACGTHSGSIKILAEGGAEPYQFQINEQAFQGNNQFEGLAPGTYQVEAKDAGGCEVIHSAHISSGVTFESVQSVIKTNCAISNCHDGTIAPDFRKQEVIQQRAARIRDRTGSQTMPPPSSGKKLTDEEIGRIACWVEDGALVENP